MTKKKLLLLIVLTLGTIFILVRHNRPVPYQKTEGMVFGTTYHIIYSSPQPHDSLIHATLNAVDASLSAFNPQSTLARWNAGDSQASDSLMRTVLSLSLEIAQATQGHFDPTVMPLVNAWGFGFKNREQITPTLLDSLLTFVGFQHVSLHGTRIERDDPRVQLDFGAIAKGFAVDCVGNALRKAGVEHFMVEIGGEVVAQGTNKEGRPWQIGVIRPTLEATEVQEVITLQYGALATSGNYRNFYLDEAGNRVAHTLSPHTGRPVAHTLLSATVEAPTCAEADAYATAFMVMGLEEAQRIVRSNTHLRALFIYEDHGKLRTLKVE